MRKKIIGITLRDDTGGKRVLVFRGMLLGFEKVLLYVTYGWMVSCVDGYAQSFGEGLIRSMGTPLCGQNFFQDYSSF